MTKLKTDLREIYLSRRNQIFDSGLLIFKSLSKVLISYLNDNIEKVNGVSYVSVIMSCISQDAKNSAKNCDYFFICHF